jgi:propionyl-CoA carboxylase alpha chain
VRLQIEVAEGRPLPFTQEAIRIDGHAIEARPYAEDPARNFLPSTGTIPLWEEPDLPDVRWDSGVVRGSGIGVHYDPMLAKVIAHGTTRDDAIDRLTGALEGLGVAGVATNRTLLLAVLRHPAFVAGELDTHFIERHLPPGARAAAGDGAAARVHAVAAALFGHESRRREGGPVPASIPSGWRNNRWRPQRVQFRVGEDTIDVAYVAGSAGRFTVDLAGNTSSAVLHDSSPRGLTLELDGVRRAFTVVTAGERIAVHSPLGTSELIELPRLPAARGVDVAGGCTAPMTGVVRTVNVKAGDRVTKGEVLLVLEAMKMEHELTAQADGIVREVRVEVGAMVDPDAVLVVVTTEGDV